MSNEILILGSGISGLTTANALQEAGYKVCIWAKDFPPHTTSNVAPAIWYPEKLEPVEQTKKWAAQTYQKFLELSENPKTGVLKRKGRKFFHRPMGNPWWKDVVVNYRRLSEKECVGAVCGHEFTGFVINMPIYLEEYLLPQFLNKGGTLEKKNVLSLEEAFESADWVINTTGLSSRELVHDNSLVPKRGQLVRISKIKEEDFILDTDHPAGMIYIVPRQTDCILGTVSEVGVEDLSIDLETSRKILERCSYYYPEIKTAEVLEAVVGLRPSRQPVRVGQVDGTNGKKLSHNYGHGGNGVTLSWGCAFEVAGVKL